MKKSDLKKLIRECLKDAIFKSAKEKPSYGDQIRIAWNKAKKEKNAEAMAYYQLLGNTSANAPFEQFKNSWAYGEWIKKPEVVAKIKEIQAELKRWFNYLNEGQRSLDLPSLKYGKLDQYADRHLALDPELPKRIDYHPHVLPRVQKGSAGPTEAERKEVERQSLEDLRRIMVDHVPLTDLYSWKVYASSFDPRGWSVPQWKYYVVGTRKA